jgi:hypothetical protein
MMPVTARLSLAVYEKLGDEVTNQLVDWFNLVDAAYKSDLREQNERNLARFEAKLDLRLTELRTAIVTDIERLITRSRQ